MLCRICGEEPATVPDRDTGGRRNEICSTCHAERLKGDMRHILAVEAKRRREREKEG
jgi:hypothetical protein